MIYLPRSLLSLLFQQMSVTLVLLLTVLFPSVHISLISLGPVFIICGVYEPFDYLSPRRYLLPWFMPSSVHALTTLTRYLLAYQNSVWLHSNQYLMQLLV